MVARSLVAVTDGAQRVALAVVRGLGRAGFPVRAVERSDRPIPVCRYSRYAREFRTWAGGVPGDGPADAGALRQALEGADVVLPVSTEAARAAASWADGRSLSPAPEVFALANDKSRLAEAARDLGLDVPPWEVVEARGELLRAAERVGLPAVLRLRDDPGLRLFPWDRYRIVPAAPDLEPAFEALAPLLERPVLSRYVAGAGLGVGVLMDRGSRPVAVFCHRRIRECPPAGGPSALCRSVRDDALAAKALRLLSGIGWVGPAMVEFRRDPATGRDWLLEVNPRYWGSLPLAQACGVDFPVLAARLVLGESVAPVTSYRVGLSMRFLHLDLAGAWWLWRSGRRAAALGVLAGLLDPRVRPGLFRCTDPLPGLAYALTGGTRGWTRRLSHPVPRGTRLS